MDKYEYKIRAEEIHNLIAEGEYAQAVEIADTIDWRRVKSIKTLCTISDLYKANRRYQESKEILLMAYERYPGGRLIVYSLCELSIKLEEYVQAIEYYKEYVQLAPKDTSRYILQYRLYEAQNVSREERIEVLEEFKRKDYRDKWAYELAYQYHLMGLASKCIDECDEIIVTFGEGRYVIKAMELKMLHTPLSATEQVKYEAWIRERDGLVAEESQVYAAENTASDMEGSTDLKDLSSAPTTEMPQEMDIQITPEDDGQYNTTNLQEALAESMKDIWGTEEPVEAPSTPEEDVEDNTIFGTGPLAGPMYAQDSETFNVDNWDNTGEIPGATEVVIPREPQIEAADIPVSTIMQDYKAPEMVSREILQEETKRIPTEAVVDYLGAQMLVDQMKHDSAALAASDIQAEKIPGAVTGSLRPIGNETYNSAYDSILTQEYDGQISIAIPDGEQIEKQITGQLSIEDIMAEWEQTKKDNEEKRKQEVKTRILQHTGSLFDDFDEDTKAGLLQQLEKAFLEAIVKEAKEGNANSDELNKRINEEAKKAVEYLNKENKETVEEAEPIEAEEIVEEVQNDEVTAETTDDEAVLDVTEAEETELPKISTEDDEDKSEEEIAEETESDDTEEDVEEDVDSEEVKAVMKALEEEAESDDEDTEEAEDVSDNDSESETEDNPTVERVLNDEEEEMFSTYMTRKSVRKQITHALENMSMASYTGNIIVTGAEGVGTLDLAKKLIKHMKSADDNFVGQAAKTSGKALNEKDLESTIDALNGGALIIECARGMKKSTVEKLIKLLEKEDLGIIVVLEDTAEGIDRMTKAIPQLSEVFNVRIDLKALDDRALVSYAQEYARSQEYSIDEFGVLALHTRIEEMQTRDHQVSVAEVRDLVDDAIYFADKKTPKHLFDVILHKRYDDEDMIILREKDFMHY